jgi:hypothetical protein
VAGHGEPGGAARPRLGDSWDHARDAGTRWPYRGRIKSFVFMEYLRRSFLIVEHSLLLDSESNFNMLLELN